MYGTNFLQISTAPEEYIAYGWYHRLHALEVSSAYRVDWHSASIRITLAAACKAIATSHNLIWTPLRISPSQSPRRSVVLVTNVVACYGHPKDSRVSPVTGLTPLADLHSCNACSRSRTAKLKSAQSHWP